jgi:hypothetical protein
MAHLTSKSWTEADIAKLIGLAESGASVLRAAAALNRRAAVVTKKARELGKPLRGVRAIKAQLRLTDPHRQDA